MDPQAQPRVSLGSLRQLGDYAVDDGKNEEDAYQRVGDPCEVLEHLPPRREIRSQQ